MAMYDFGRIGHIFRNFCGNQPPKLSFTKYIVEMFFSFELAFHPSGFHLLVGFPDRLRLLNILLNDLRIQTEFNGIRGCNECKFANGGHLFACVVHNDKIQIISTWNGQKLHNLRGHTQTVNSLCFTSTDEFLISAG